MAKQGISIRFTAQGFPITGKITATFYRTGKPRQAYNIHLGRMQSIRSLLQGKPCITAASTGGWTETYLLSNNISSMLI